MQQYDSIIFDLGAVLIDWNPRYLYNKIFTNPEETAHFLENICTSEWNEEQDAGRPLADATEMLVEQHPAFEQHIRAYYGRWPEMLGGAIAGTLEILKELKDSGRYKLYALTNWSAETFPLALSLFPFLEWFDGIVVSGHEKIRKPHPDFYNLLVSRYHIDPAKALFIDDNLRNVHGATACGIESIHFTSPEQLKQVLHEKAILS